MKKLISIFLVTVMALSVAVVSYADNTVITPSGTNIVQSDSVIKVGSTRDGFSTAPMTDGVNAPSNLVQAGQNNDTNNKDKVWQSGLELVAESNREYILLDLKESKWLNSLTVYEFQNYIKGYEVWYTDNLTAEQLAIEGQNFLTQTAESWNVAKSGEVYQGAAVSGAYSAFNRGGQNLIRAHSIDFQSIRARYVMFVITSAHAGGRTDSNRYMRYQIAEIEAYHKQSANLANKNQIKTIDVWGKVYSNAAADTYAVVTPGTGKYTIMNSLATDAAERQNTSLAINFGDVIEFDTIKMIQRRDCITEYEWYLISDDTSVKAIYDSSDATSTELSANTISSMGTPIASGTISSKPGSSSNNAVTHNPNSTDTNYPDVWTFDQVQKGKILVLVVKGNRQAKVGPSLWSIEVYNSNDAADTEITAPTTAAAGTAFDCTAVLGNSGVDKINSALFAAQYDNEGKMIGVQGVPASLGTYASVVDVRSITPASGAKTIKLFAWNMDSLNPLDFKEITVTQQ